LSGQSSMTAKQEMTIAGPAGLLCRPSTTSAAIQHADTDMIFDPAIAQVTSQVSAFLKAVETTHDASLHRGTGGSGKYGDISGATLPLDVVMI
jgi:hypothetical protein